MMTLSGTSVATSISSPPGGAGVGTVKVTFWVWPEVSVSEEGATLTSVGSTRNVPTGELPPGFSRVTW